MGLKVAIMGTRGIPANYGGFETFAENISTLLVKRGHDVTVYGRSNFINYKDKFYNGVRLIILPTIRHKYFDTIAHTFFSACHAFFKERYDVVLICNSANSIFSFIPRLRGQKVAINVDGLEWQRKKWNKLGQWFYRISEFFATIFADKIVTDSIFIKKYYLKKFNSDSVFIPYGAPIEKIPSNDTLKKYNLEEKQYVLYVSRLEPENNAHRVVKAFEKVKTDKKLVIVGDAPYNSKYIQDLKNTNDPRIIFTGYVFDNGYKELQSNAYFYIQATEVGGTHPALLEGMGFGNCVLANDVPEHREVIKEAGLYFSAKNDNDLVNRMQYLLDNPTKVKEFAKLAFNRILECYTWDKITDEYEKLFLKLSSKKRKVSYK